jgi:cytochrome c peroxidase
LAAGCWSQDDLIDGTFTPEQWAKLQLDFQIPAMDPCTVAGLQPGSCGAAQDLARQMFNDSGLSGGHCSMTTTRACWSQADCPSGETCPAWTPVACATCHDVKNALIDSRTPDNVSQGSVGWTKRNSMTLLNLGYKDKLAAGRDAFSWAGGAKLPGDDHVTHFTTAGSVFELALRKPMSSSAAHVGLAVRTSGPYYMDYRAAAFGDPGYQTDAVVLLNIEKAFDAYLATFVTKPTPFDQYLAGNADAISASAKRGFAVFIGRGTCVECHSGAMFSDYDFHDTGVPQQGARVPDVDLGRGDVTGHQDDGKFVTPSLREIAKTGPYMHDGAMQTLADVIAFYRQGGVGNGFSGTRDPRIQPLDLTDQDAQDLEAFLRTLSQDAPVGGGGSGMHQDAGVPPVPDAWPSCAPGFDPCGIPPMCVPTQVDPMNCGVCGHMCMASQICAMGYCQ